MTLSQRSQALAGLYEIQGRLFALRLTSCSRTEKLLEDVNQAIEEIRPEVPCPPQLDFPVPKR
jgi:hypothetical protein